VAPAAFADVTISGSINMGVEYLNVGEESTTFATKAAPFVGGNGTPHAGVGNVGVASNYTNITIASMEDLGGGLKLDFAAQIDWNTTAAGNSTGATLGNRNSHIGLVGESWGGVWYGSNENIYERYFYTQDPLDGAAGLGGNLQIMGTPGGAVFTTCGKGSTTGGFDPTTGLSSINATCGYTWYRRDAQAIWYDSPNWNGFTFGAAVQTDFDKSAYPNSSINPWMFQIGAKYVGTSLPLQAWGAYGYRKDQFGLVNFIGTYVTAINQGAPAGSAIATNGTTFAGGPGSKDKAFQLGAGYTLGDVYFFGVYEQIKYDLENVAAGYQDWKRNAYQIGVKWNLASGYVGASWMQALDASCTFVGAGPANFGCEDTGAYSIGVGYYHTMSKQTQLYVVGSWLDNQDQGNYGTAGIGNSASFKNVGATYWGAGVGIKHSF
jgi:predicted porin